MQLQAQVHVRNFMHLTHRRTKTDEVAGYNVCLGLNDLMYFDQNAGYQIYPCNLFSTCIVYCKRRGTHIGGNLPDFGTMEEVY